MSAGPLAEQILSAAAKKPMAPQVSTAQSTIAPAVATTDLPVDKPIEKAPGEVPADQAPSWDSLKSVFTTHLKDIVPEDILSSIEAQAKGKTGWEDFFANLATAVSAGFDPAITREMLSRADNEKTTARDRLVELYSRVGQMNVAGRQQVALTQREEIKAQNREDIAKDKLDSAEYQGRQRQLGQLQNIAKEAGVAIGAPTEDQLRDPEQFQQWYNDASNKVAGETGLYRFRTEELPKLAQQAAKTGVDFRGVLGERLQGFGIAPDDPRYAEMLRTFGTVAKQARAQAQAETENRRQLTAESQSRVAKNQSIVDKLEADVALATQRESRLDIQGRIALADRLGRSRQATTEKMALFGQQAQVAMAANKPEIAQPWLDAIGKMQDHLTKLDELDAQLKDATAQSPATVEESLQRQWPVILQQMKVPDFSALAPEDREVFMVQLMANVWADTGGALEDVATLLDSGPAGKSMIDRMAGADVSIAPDLQQQAQDYVNYSINSSTER